MNKLILMMGTPGSGKTTLAKKLFTGDNVYYISRDEIRNRMLKRGEEFFSHENDVYLEFIKEIIAALQKENSTVIADQTSLNKNSRAKFFNTLKDYGGNPDKIIVLWVKRPLEQTLKLNAKRKGRERVPDGDLTKMFFRIQKPTKFEGIDELHIYDAERNTFTVEKFK